MSILKNLIKKAIRFIAVFIGKTRTGKYFYENIINIAMGKVKEISHASEKFKFVTPNILCDWRVQTFSTKEPETLEWIDSIPEGATLWDIGANIGLYSIYAAKKRKCRVLAFEPSVFNLELLARNIFLNDLTDSICIVPLALNDTLGINQLQMTSMDWGGALSTFGQSYGWNGKTIQQIFKYQILGLRMEDVVQRLLIPKPDYIKMDVDGIEHLILKGGPDILSNIKGILIEVNDNFYEQATACQSHLSAAGLVLTKKQHSEIIENATGGFEKTYNQIWARL